MKKNGLKLLTSLALTAAMMFSSGGFLIADTDVDTDTDTDAETESAEIVIDARNFPDEVFRNYIKTVIDTDHNNGLSAAEIEATVEINVSGASFETKITSLQGIQNFSALRELHCDNNVLVTLDLSNNTKLRKLYCDNNELVTLDLSSNPNLEILYCHNNSLTSLNIANHPLLWTLGVQNNPGLTLVDIRGCQYLLDTYFNGTQTITDNRTIRSYTVDGATVGYMDCDSILEFDVEGTPPVQNPTFVGHALQLTGTIGLQFFVQLPAGADSDAYTMTFANAHGHISESEEFRLQSTAKVSEPDTYMVQINLSSIMLAEEFTPTLHCGEQTWSGEAYSVEDYIIWGSTNLPSGSKAMTVVRALADYGYYAQPYLSGVNGWPNNGSVYTQMTTHFTDSYDYADIRNTYGDSAIIINNLNGSGISQVRYSLRFGDNVSLRVYLKPSSGSIDGDGVAVTGGYSGAGVDKTQTGDEYNRFAVTMTGIPATYLLYSYTIMYNGAEIVVSPMSYVYGMLSSPAAASRNDACDLVSAFYYYCIACAQ